MSNWIFPVVGANEWSPGSWMPNTYNHRNRKHAAVDIYADRGSPIISPVGGTIKMMDTSSIGGNWIQVSGDDGNVYYFAHMDSHANLRPGQRISPGTTLGLVGNTGSAKSTSPHLHFSVKRGGTAISPIDMLRGGLVIPNVAAGEMNWDKGSRVLDAARGVEPGELDPRPPAWVDQLEQYRADRAAGSGTQPTELQQRAGDVLRRTLGSMAAMVQQYGFQSEGELPDTGIDEGESDADMDGDPAEDDTTGVTQVKREEEPANG